MRKLRVFESISVDGYFTDANGDMSWAHAGREDAEFGRWVSSNAGSGGELLFGRKTYQMMEAFWPTPAAAEQMPEVAKGMNAARKYVASKTIQPTWNNTQLLKGDPVKAVRDLKKRTDRISRCWAVAAWRRNSAKRISLTNTSWSLSQWLSEVDVLCS